MLVSSLRSPVLHNHNFQTRAKPFGQTPVNGQSNIRLFNDPNNSILQILKPRPSYHHSRISNLKMHLSQPLMIYSQQTLDFQVGLTSIVMVVKVGWVNYQGQASHKQATSTNFHRLAEMAMMSRGMTQEGV